MLKSEYIYQACSLIGIWGAGIVWAMIGCNFMPFTQQGLAIFVLAGLSVFSIHCIGFIFSYLYVTEKYYDIVGSVCFVTTTAAILWYVKDQLTIRTFILGMAVIVWSLRLGIYLGVRVMKVGKDQRFDKIKVHFGQFAVARAKSERVKRAAASLRHHQDVRQGCRQGHVCRRCAMCLPLVPANRQRRRRTGWRHELRQQPDGASLRTQGEPRGVSRATTRPDARPAASRSRARGAHAEAEWKVPARARRGHLTFWNARYLITHKLKRHYCVLEC